MPLLTSVAVLTQTFALMPDYRTVDEKHPTQFEGYYRQAKAAKIKNKGYQDTKLKYSDYDAGVNYTYTLNPEHFLTLGLGTYHNTINWQNNPAFLGENYDYVVGSLGLTSLGIENWRWSAASVLSFQTQNFGIFSSGWISLMFWGQYTINDKMSFHAGFWGYTGVKNIYFLPILGFDFKNKHFELAAIFPFDIAARYLINKNFHMEIAGKWFGGPYRFPQRMNHGINGYENGIFEIFAPTTEFGIYYHPSAHIYIGASGGYTWGGWISVRNKHNQANHYYDLEAVPYGMASAVFKF